jgi:hypothetical protein
MFRTGFGDEVDSFYRGDRGLRGIALMELLIELVLDGGE